MSIAAYSPMNASRYVKALLYGRPGSGKTYFCGTAAEVGKLLFLNLEGGDMSIPKIHRSNMVNIDIANPDAFEQVLSVIQVMASPEKERPDWGKKIATIVLDSGSELQTLVMESVISAKSETMGSKHGRWDTWLEDYGDVTTRLSYLFRQLRSLPYNVLVTALLREHKVGDTNIISRITPEFTPKLGGTIEGYFDHVWAVARVNSTTTFLTQPRDNIYQVKTRGTAFPEALGDRLTDPTFKQVYDLLLSTEK